MLVSSSLRFAATIFLWVSACANTGFSLPYQPRDGLSYSAPAAQPSDKIDINRASMAALLTVPGMTRTWAARIIRYRPYRAKNDLLERGIVTSQVYDRIKDYIVAHRAKP